MEILGPPGGGGWVEGWQEALEALAKRGGERDRIPALVSLGKKLAGWGEWQSVLEGMEDWWAEYPLPQECDESSGGQRCDLLIQKGDKLVIVDWKTGVRSTGKEQEYAHQVLGYMEGLKRALAGSSMEGLPVEGWVVWVDEDGERMVQGV